MEQNGKRCTFEGCSNLAHDGYSYCLHHLQHLTEDSVKQVVSEILMEELGVEASEVTPNARFIDDLGATSLDQFEMVIAFEKAFNSDIPTEDAKKIQGVRDTISYVTNRLLSGTEPQFLIDHNVNIETIHENIEQNPENISRLLKQIVQSPLFQDYISRLRLKSANVERMFSLAVRNNWVDHITTVPEFDEGKALSRVSIIILCGKVIHYFILKVKSVSFNSYLLSELRLSYQINYSEGGEVSEIEVSAGLRHSRGVDEAFTFKTQEGVEGALTFLDKCLRNMEALK